MLYPLEEKRIKIRYFIAYTVAGLYTIATFIKVSPVMGLTPCFIFAVVIGIKSLCSFRKPWMMGVLTRSVKQTYLLLLICCLSMMFTSVCYMLWDPEHYQFGIVVMDICAMMTLLSGMAMAIPHQENSMEKVLFMIGGLSCLVGLYALTQCNFDAAVIAKRRVNILNIQYGLWKTMECWPFLILFLTLRNKTMEHRRRKIYITVFCTLEYVVLSQVFLKRVVFFDMACLLLVILLANRLSLMKLWKPILLAVVIACFAYFFITSSLHYDLVTIIKNTMNRFDGTTVAEFDRLVEFKDLFQQFDPTFLIWGRGFGSVQDGPGGGNLHLGLLNYIFKGGLLLAGVMMIVFWKSFLVLISNTSMNKKAYSAAVVYTLMRSAISPIWVPNVTRFLFAACIVLSLMEYDNLYNRKQIQISVKLES